MPTLTILHGCRTLQLSRGMNTLVDEADFPRVSRMNWYARPSRDGRKFYAVHTMNRTPSETTALKLHRFILNATSDVHVDHWNGDTLDNCRSNLRLATRIQNAQNQRVALGESPFKGVSRAGTSWRARIRVNGQLVQLGCHRTQQEAARAYDAAAIEHFGEFACTNADLHGAY